jgi:hypothetical protein
MSGNTVMLLVLGGAALLVALALGLIRWRMGRLKRAIEIAKRWPTVPGRVVGGSIDTRVFSRGVSYGVLIEYEYDIGGRRYRSKRFSLSGPEYVSFEGRAKRRLAKFPVGTPVTVSYDPAKPGDGVISLSAPFILVLRVIFWIVLVLMVWLIGAPLVFEPVFGPKPLRRL